MATFGIATPHELLNKLVEEQSDFEASDRQSARHAINATMTAYHLHEWVWGGFVKGRPDLHRTWGLNPGGKATIHDFLAWLEKQCPAITAAQKITNGTKHFNTMSIPTGTKTGAFQDDAFQSDAFDVSHLWLDRDGKPQRAEHFLEELVAFWREFFRKYVP